ncbi:MAG: MoxR family ATPase [Pseudomonadota bacterium]
MDLPHPQQLAEQVETRIERVVAGGGPLGRALLTALLAQGHCLIQGVPGTGKTLLGQAFARLVGLDFRRVQLTPDLLPADLTGTLVLDLAEGQPRFRPGPIFTGLLMADEVNRAPPRTQAALLEAMEERQVTVDGVSHPLDPSFTLLATLNTIETEGTWPLPEAQRDRFTLCLQVDYPSMEVEARLLARGGDGPDPRTSALPALTPLLDAGSLAALVAASQRVRLEEPVRAFLLELVHAARHDPRVALGPSPRATLQLARLSRARALLSGRDHALPDDVAALLQPALAHRIALLPEAMLDGERPAQVLADARARVEVPR